MFKSEGVVRLRPQDRGKSLASRGKVKVAEQVVTGAYPHILMGLVSAKMFGFRRFRSRRGLPRVVLILRRLTWRESLQVTERVPWNEVLEPQRLISGSRAMTLAGCGSDEGAANTYRITWLPVASRVFWCEFSGVVVQRAATPWTQLHRRPSRLA